MEYFPAKSAVSQPMYKSRDTHWRRTWAKSVSDGWSPEILHGVVSMMAGTLLSRSSWIPGSYAPALSEKHNACLRPLKIRASRRRAGQNSGWTPSACPRPWNPTRALLLCKRLTPLVCTGFLTDWNNPQAEGTQPHSAADTITVVVAGVSASHCGMLGAGKRARIVATDRVSIHSPQMPERRQICSASW
jgi:hypothetical protein